MSFTRTQLVAVRRIVQAGAVFQENISRMTIAPDNNSGVTIRVPFAPNEVQHEERGSEWAVLTRPLLTPILVRARARLPQMSFDLTIVDKQVFVSQGSSFWLDAETTITQLDSYATSGTRLRVSYGQYESGLWYITSFSFKTERYGPSNEVVQAMASLVLRRAGDAIDAVGPLTGGVKPSQPSPAPAPPPQQTGSRTYAVKAGDTLWAISIKFYGTGTKWTQIANANGVKDPRRLQIGKVLRIP